MITKQEFERQYAKNSGLTVEQIKSELIAVECQCNESGCRGWQMITKKKQNKG